MRAVINTSGSTILSIVVVHASTRVQRAHAKITLPFVHIPIISPDSTPVHTSIDANIAAEPSKLFRVPGMRCKFRIDVPTTAPIASPTPVAMSPAAPASSGSVSETADADMPLEIEEKHVNVIGEVDDEVEEETISTDEIQSGIAHPARR